MDKLTVELEQRGAEWHASIPGLEHTEGLGMDPEEAISSLFRQIKEQQFVKWVRMFGEEAPS